MSMADRILLMRQGELVQAGTPEDLYHRPVDLDAARFFCDFNEIEAVVENGLALTPLGGFPVERLGEGERAVVMIRPQGLVPTATEAAGAREARIETSRFLGEVQELTAWVEGLDHPLIARVPATGAPREGETLGLSVDHRQVLVFAADGAATI
jgi:iron(III) transport system ATP-binding protein